MNIAMLKWALRKTALAFYKDKQFLELRMHWIAGRIVSGSELLPKITTKPPMSEKNSCESSLHCGIDRRSRQ
jgi:hypothetical protein